MSNYNPPYTITPTILNLIAEICESLGRYFAISDADMKPRLRRENRIRTIHASLAIENNTLTLEQVTAIFDGKRVLGLPREIQEVRNAFSAYECLARWNPTRLEDFLEAHSLLMFGLVDLPGAFRSSGVGIFQGDHIAHIAPPADRVQFLVRNLLNWLEHTEEHPLIASCVMHYEIEFIHPFLDGNGRLGRLWQTLTLSRWKKFFAFIPVESLIHDRQDDYYHVLGACDHQGTSTLFIEFMLKTLQDALADVIETCLTMRTIRTNK